MSRAAVGFWESRLQHFELWGVSIGSLGLRGSGKECEAHSKAECDDFPFLGHAITSNMEMEFRGRGSS